MEGQQEERENDELSSLRQEKISVDTCHYLSLLQGTVFTTVEIASFQQRGWRNKASQCRSVFITWNCVLMTRRA